MDYLDIEMMNAEDKREMDTDEETRQALKLWVTLAKCFASMAEVARQSIAAFGLIPSEFGVMEMLYHKGPLPLSEVGKGMLLTSGSITYVVDKLEKSGWVRRAACPSDRRVIYAELTEEGEARIREIFPAHAARIKEAVSGLNPDEREIATVLLRKMGLHAEGL
jgi:MarR family 2-MHQ and catechol resistance regulon transcriptional repressor